MGSKVQLNYDELRTAVKKFRNEGEDVVHMHSSLRSRVHDLHKDWVGEGADKFFNEMENDLLPALTRLSRALFYAQDVLHKIIQTIQAFDEDTVGYFKIDFSQVNSLNLGAFLAGAGIAGGIGGMAGGSLPGGLPGGLPGVEGSGVGVPAGEGLSGAATTDSMSGTGEPVPGSGAGSGQVGGVDQTSGAGGQLPGSSSGAGVGGSSSQGLPGDLQGMGGGVGSQGGGGGGGVALGGGSLPPDHIYDGSSGAGASGSSAQTAQAAASGGGSEGSTGNEGNVAAGAAGVAGSAALGVAGKTIKRRFRKKTR